MYDDDGTEEPEPEKTSPPPEDISVVLQNSIKSGMEALKLYFNTNVDYKPEEKEEVRIDKTTLLINASLGCLQYASTTFYHRHHSLHRIT